MADITDDAMRQQAIEHAEQMAAARWPGVPVLAARWGISAKLVRAIPRAKLPYLMFGKSGVRRYDPSDVASYEQAEKHGAAA